MKKILVALFLALLIMSGCTNKTDSTKISSSSTTTITSSADLMDDETFFDKAIKTFPAVNSDNYNPDNYKYYDYKTLLRKSEKVKGLEISVPNLEIFQISEEGKYTKILAMTPNNDIYMLIIETSRLETKLLKEDDLTINGQFIYAHRYITKNDDINEVPLIYINAYRLNN